MIEALTDAQPSAPATEQTDLSTLPPVQAVLAGQPPAVYVPAVELSQQSPVVQTLAANMEGLAELGLSIYRATDKVVLFNPELVGEDQLRQADESGQLESLASPLESLMGGEGSPAPQTPAGAPTPTPGAATITPRTQAKLAGTRLQHLIDDDKPSERKIPGGGKILNSLLKRAV